MITSDPQEVRELYNLAGLGMDATAFLKSDFGRYILTKVADERADALIDLASIAPTDAEGIRALQSIIRRCDSFEDWIREAIEAGKNAESMLQQGDQE